VSVSYRSIFEDHYGPWPHPCHFCGDLVEDGKGSVVHHIDHDRRHNDPSNLSAAHDSCHRSYHSRLTVAQEQEIALARFLVWAGERGEFSASHFHRDTHITSDLQTLLKLTATRALVVCYWRRGENPAYENVPPWANGNPNEVERRRMRMMSYRVVPLKVPVTT
jgi:HNH endonuclease